MVIGDTDRVMSNSKQALHNPFENNTRDVKVQNHEDWKNIKNYAVLDGALIIDKDGYVVSAGRYLYMGNLDLIEIQEGLGGRHQAGASITTMTRAVSIIVSAEGEVRVFMDGKQIYYIQAK